MTTASAGEPLPPDLAEALHARLTGQAPAGARPGGDDSDALRPLSSAERRIWFVDGVAGATPVHTVSAAMRLHGALDHEALRRAVRAVVARHEALRTVLVEDDAGPFACTLPSVDIPVRQVVCRHDTGAALVLTDLVGHPFDLTAEPPLRVHLIAVGPRQHILLLLVHHIACDAQSLDVLVTDLDRAYRGESLPPLVQRYADVARWQHQRTTASASRTIAYWRNRLAGAPPVLDLGCALPRPAHPTYRGRVHTLRLPTELVDAASRLGVDRGATLSSVLLAAWLSVLRRHSGQDDIVIGTAVAGREAAGAEQVIGPLVNLVPLRVRVDPIASADDLLVAARNALLGALDHAILPFDRIVEAVGPVRSPSHHPVFQVTFDVRHSTAYREDFGGLRAEPVRLDTAAAAVDLALSVDRTPAGWAVRLVAATDLFTADNGAGLLDDFVRALRALTTSPAGPTPAPARPSPAPEPPASTCRTVLDMIDDWTARRPDAVAIVDTRRVLRYRDLDQRSRALAGHLSQLGVDAETPVGVYVDRSVDLAVGLLGVLRAGGAYLPLDPDHPTARTEAVLADAGARLVLTRTDLLDTLPTSAVTPVLVDAEHRDALGTPARVLPGSLAYVIYTSGSTGTPKGVEVTHANLASFLHALGEMVSVDPSDTLLAVTTVAFDIAALELFLPLARGARVVLAPSGSAGDAPRLRELIAAHDATILQATPVTWRILLGDATTGPRLRVALCGGERLPADLAGRITAVSPRAWNVYGPTETTIWSTAQPLDPAVEEPVPIGMPLPGTRAYVVDRKLRPVLPGDPGELCLAGAGVARGYRNRPGLTAERFVPDPFDSGGRLYRTGDRVRMRDDGTLEYLGRLDDQLKVRGLRIEPGEIESVARSLPGVRDAVVTAPPGRDGESMLTCHVLLKPPADDQRQIGTRIRDGLREILPRHLVPDAIIPIAALPLTPSGKVDRRALPAPRIAGTRGASAGPRDEMERAVAEVWLEVLARPTLGVDDDFYALGGHSLLATRIAARLRDRLGVDVPLRLILDHPTVSGLARMLTAGQPLDLPPLKAGAHDHTDPGPLTVAQQQVWQLGQDPAASLAYHVHTVLLVPGHVTTAALRASVDALTARHCVLQTRYRVVDGQPRQLVDGSDDADFDEVRLPEAAVAGFLGMEVRQPFALADAPPVRWRLVRVTGGRPLLLLAAHHISLDGWSIELLARELAALWEGADLPAARCFSAVARWQQRALYGAEMQRQRRYWRQRLALPRAMAAPPYDRTPPSRPDFRGDVVRTTVTGEAGRLARGLDATLFMTLLAAFVVELRRHGDHDDVCVGVPMSARRLRDLEGVAGMLVNTVVLRCDLAGDPTFAEVVRRLRSAVLDAHANQELPFAEVVRDADAQRGAGRNPLYQTMFGFDTSAHQYPRAHNGTAKLDLTVMVEPEGDGADLAVSWEYATQVLDRSTVASMAARYATLVAAACRDPHRPLSALAPRRTVRPVPAGRPPVHRTTTATEALIATAYAEALGVTEVGPDDDFFALGGHSLMAARVIAAIGRRIGAALPTRMLMEHPTVTGLAAAVSTTVAPARPAPVRGDGRLVLVTGGTGLVGGAVVAELRRRGARVRVLARPASHARARVIADEVAAGDLVEADSLAEAVRGVDAVVHAACTFTRPDVDIAAMARLVACRADRPFVFISSADVYGQPDTMPIGERHPSPAVLSEYARAKLACERLLTTAGGSGFALLRPPYVWAPHPYCVWQLRETAGAPVERALRTGASLTLPPPGRGHAWLDARDLAWVVAECLDHPPDGPLNVIGGHFDWRDLAATVMRLRRLPVRCRDGEPSGLYATHRRFDGTLAGRRLGFAPRRRWARTLSAAFRAADAAKVTAR